VLNAFEDARDRTHQRKAQINFKFMRNENNTPEILANDASALLTPEG